MSTKRLTFGSLFSGIGGFDLAFERAGMACKWQVEIDAKCQGVLGRHWPEVEKHSDIRECGRHNLEPVDVVCGGFPCQDLSVAGRRAGLAGERSGLWFEFHRVLAELEPRWVVIENVPGLLSSNGGRDFATVIRGLVELRYGVCWRVLDAQYFGVAQRRRRVFIVGHLGDGRAAEVLFEREGVPGNTPPSRETGQEVAAPTPGSFGEYRQGVGALRANGGDLGGGSETFIAYGISENQRGEVRLTDYSRQITSGGGKPGQGYPAVAYRDVGHYGLEITSPDGVSGPLLQGQSGGGGTNNRPCVAYNIQHNDGGEHKRSDRPNGGLYVNETDTALTVGTTDMTAVCFAPGNLMRRAGEEPNEHVVGTLGAEKQGDMFPCIAFDWQQGADNQEELTATLNTTRVQAVSLHTFGVRRLTPVECERLQGFPDGHTDGQSDSARYRQLGNAVAVPVVEWIGRRIVDRG